MMRVAKRSCVSCSDQFVLYALRCRLTLTNGLPRRAVFIKWDWVAADMSGRLREMGREPLDMPVGEIALGYMGTCFTVSPLHLLSAYEPSIDALRRLSRLRQKNMISERIEGMKVWINEQEFTPKGDEEFATHFMTSSGRLYRAPP